MFYDLGWYLQAKPTKAAMVQTFAAHIVTKTKKFDHVIPVSYSTRHEDPLQSPFCRTATTQRSFFIVQWIFETPFAKTLETANHAVILKTM